MSGPVANRPEACPSHTDSIGAPLINNAVYRRGGGGGGGGAGEGSSL